MSMNQSRLAHLALGTAGIILVTLFHFFPNSSLVYAHSSTPVIQETSLVVVASPSNVNRDGTVTITATVLAHRTGGTTNTNWSVQLTLPSGYSLSGGANPQSASTGSHASTTASWTVTAPSVPSGPDTFTVTATATDASTGTALSGSPEIDTLTVTTVNRVPIASDDLATIAEDTPSVVINVLSNDTDADNDTLLISSISSLPSNGTAQITDSGTTITYSPDENFFGTDSLDYTIEDGRGGTETGTVTIIVTSVNDAPIAVNDTYTTDEDVILTVPDIGLVSNDTDVENDVLAAILEQDVQNGTLTLYTNGSFVYLPDLDFNGQDGFTYFVNDGNDNSNNVATVNITVSSVNDSPVAVGDSYSVNEDGTLDVPVGLGVLANDTDVEEDILSSILIADVTNGNISLNSEGSFTYVPAVDFNGLDIFTYRANDGSLNSTLANVTVTVFLVNDPPSPNDDVYTIMEDTPIIGLDVLGNDTDVDFGDVLSLISIASPPSNGDARINSTDNTIAYSPELDFDGVDSFQYTVSDTNGGTELAIVTITVNSVNDAPVAYNETASVDGDSQVSINLGGNDVDGDVLTYFIVSGPLHGTLTGVNASSGAMTYVPVADFSGQDGFAFLVSDSIVNSTVAHVSITVNPVDEQTGGNRDAEDRGSDNRRDVPEEELAAKRLTYEDSYFDDKPMEKVQIQSAKIIDSDGAGFSSVSEGEKVTISYSFRNYQQKSQEYCFIVQVQDEEGVTEDIQFSKGELGRGEQAKIEQDWEAEDVGEYTVKVFIWDQLDHPTPLSDMDILSVNVR